MTKLKKNSLTDYYYERCRYRGESIDDAKARLIKKRENRSNASKRTKSKKWVIVPKKTAKDVTEQRRLTTKKALILKVI